MKNLKCDMKITATTICPKCGYKNKTQITELYQKGIILCDVEDGGCDEYYAAFFNVKVESEIKLLKAQESQS